MAKRAATLTGLEIEPSAIHAVTVTGGGRLEIQTAAFAPLEPGVVRDGEVTDPDALTEALRELFREHKNLDKRVRVGIARRLTSTTAVVYNVVFAQIPRVFDSDNIPSGHGIITDITLPSGRIGDFVDISFRA